ncbi:probable E3 ubiquitin ligase complex SCF subunit sconB [Exaiptasia diaphana]|uniref:F-box domain-containing protein n=1 Tax=Exaiptasia diaphana TaxID=2652724 RepID=A0A913XT09_EXADI|nr:probable E3 ubiquitin ligase complex SCF subunit sconB [Exaiptasia diaphana]
MLFNSPLAKHMSTIEFEQQLDYLCQWLDAWTDRERANVIEVLLPRCGCEEINFLWTVVEPTLHRDFMYSSLNAFPRSSFSPVSIPIPREVHKKLGKPRYRTWKLHRLSSAILHDEEEVRQWSSQSVLPIVKPSVSPVRTPKSTPSPYSEPKGAWKCLTTYYGVRLPGISSPGPANSRSCRNYSTKSAPPTMTKTSSHHPIRRHMQDDFKKGTVNCENGTRTDSYTWRRLYKSKSCPSMQNPVGREYKRSSHRNRSSSDVNNNTALQLSSIPENAQSIVQWFEERWNGWQRNQFLRLFLRVLEPAELYLLSGLLAVRQYRDFIALLPDHLALRILSYLSPSELLIAAQVSKTWRQMSSRNELWLAKCSRIYVGIPLRVPTIWKETFKQNLKLKRNWANGECRVMDISGHTKNVLSVCEFRDTIASGSLDRSIKIWDANTGSLLMTLNGHTRGIWSLRFLSPTILISGSYDKSIRVWSLRTGICSRILLGHEAPVWAIERKEDILVSGSGDKTAKLWNIRQCKQIRTLFGHTCSVFCVDLDDKATRAFTGSADRTVRIWDVVSGACVGIVHAGHSHASAVTAVSFDQGHIAVATGSVISLWNLTTGACLQELKGHKARGNCIQTLRGINQVVNCIQADDTRIISASFDGKIRIWDFNK